MSPVALIRAVFVDPLTTRFVLFYIPALILVIVIAIAYEKRRPTVVPRSSRSRRGSLSERTIELGGAFADWLAASGITPNQISCLGLLLGFANCALYLYHGNSFWLGIGLALCFPFDSLDGLVARRQNRITKFGAYLDASVDRYQEIASSLVIAIVTGWWMVLFFVITGAMLVSYNKARAAIEIPIDNKGWPDLMVQHRRLFLLCFGLAGDACIPWLLHFVLITLAAASHFTAIQRFLRARRILCEADQVTVVQA